MMALDYAPSKLWENNQFFLPIINDFIARSAKLFERTRFPSSNKNINTIIVFRSETLYILYLEYPNTPTSILTSIISPVSDNTNGIDSFQLICI